MPKNPAPNFIQKLRGIRMSESRRTSMRAELAAYADLHAVIAPHRAAYAQRSPYVFRMFAGVSAFVAMIMVTGAGATFASGQALPGDILYPMKVSIAEPVEAALTRTPEAKAEFHVELAERRLEEATLLAAKNKLDAKKQALIATAVDKHVETSDVLADALETDGKADVSIALRSDLEARLTAHAEILSMIGNHLVRSSSAEETGRQARTLAVHVQVRKDVVAQERQEREFANASVATSLKTVVAAAKKTDQAIATMQAQATNGASEPVEDHVGIAASALVDVKDQLEADQPKAAARQAQEAARASEVAAIILRHDPLLKALGITASSTLPAATTTPAVNVPLDPQVATSTATTSPINLKAWIRFRDGAE